MTGEINHEFFDVTFKGAKSKTTLTTIFCAPRTHP